MLQAQHPTENDPMPFSRAVIAACEAKLRDQEPVAYMTYKGYLLHAGDPKVLEHNEPTPLFEHPAPIPEGWRPLTDVQWMNIVNHAHAWQSYDKEEAIHEVVKMVESKLRDNNLPMAARSGE
jgi:hypothetical protein